jgi:hypothetical protein
MTGAFFVVGLALLFTVNIARGRAVVLANNAAG